MHKSHHAAHTFAHWKSNLCHVSTKIHCFAILYTSMQGAAMSVERSRSKTSSIYFPSRMLSDRLSSSSNFVLLKIPASCGANVCQVNQPVYHSNKHRANRQRVQSGHWNRSPRWALRYQGLDLAHRELLLLLVPCIFYLLPQQHVVQLGCGSHRETTLPVVTMPVTPLQTTYKGNHVGVVLTHKHVY